MELIIKFITSSLHNFKYLYIFFLHKNSFIYSLWFFLLWCKFNSKRILLIFYIVNARKSMFEINCRKFAYLFITEIKLTKTILLLGIITIIAVNTNFIFYRCSLPMISLPIKLYCRYHIYISDLRKGVWVCHIAYFLRFSFKSNIRWYTALSCSLQIKSFVCIFYYEIQRKCLFWYIHCKANST